LGDLLQKLLCALSSFKHFIKLNGFNAPSRIVDMTHAYSSHIFVYIGTNNNGNKNKSGAKIRIRITPITDPKIKLNQNTNPVIINPVTIRFQSNLNGKSNIFSSITSPSS